MQEKMKCYDSILGLSNHPFSHYLKQTYFRGILEQLFFGIPDYWARHSFMRNMLIGLQIYQILNFFS